MKWDKQSNEKNAYVQSLGITIMPIGYGSWETQDEMNQTISMCTRSS